MFYLSTYLQWFASYRWKAVKQDDKTAFAVPKGPFRVNSQGKWSTYPLQFSWNFTEIVITPYDEHLQHLN